MFVCANLLYKFFRNYYFSFLFTWKIIGKMVIIIIKKLKRKKKFEYFKNLEEYDTSDIILYLKSLIEIFAYYGY